MSEAIRIEIDTKHVLRKLKNVETKAPKVFRNAINRTATQAMKIIKQGRSHGYTVKPSRFNEDLGKIQRATAEHLDATIKAKGKPLTFSGSFKTSMSKAGGKADITKSGLKPLVSSKGGAAFIPSAGKAAGLMTQRHGKERFKVKVLHGPSVPKMVEQIYKGKLGNEALEPFIRKTLHEELRKELTKLI